MTDLRVGVRRPYSLEGTAREKWKQRKVKVKMKQNGSLELKLLFTFKKITVGFCLYLDFIWGCKQNTTTSNCLALFKWVMWYVQRWLATGITLHHSLVQRGGIQQGSELNILAKCWEEVVCSCLYVLCCLGNKQTYIFYPHPIPKHQIVAGEN